VLGVLVRASNMARKLAVEELERIIKACEADETAGSAGLMCNIDSFGTRPRRLDRILRLIAIINS
jgi:hypothetical protein